MHTTIESLLNKLKTIKTINDERLLQASRKRAELEKISEEIEKYKELYQTAKFTAEKLSEYYILERDSNLNVLANLVGQFMTNLLGKEYEVNLKVVRRGNYDYLEKTVNGIDVQHISGGEKQAFSLGMITETLTNGVLVLDETINSIHGELMDKVIEYLNIMGKEKQVFLIELDSNLKIPVTFLAENNTVRRVFNE